MFNSKKSRGLTEYEMSELMNFISQTMHQMLSTGEQVIQVLEKYGFAIVVSSQKNYYQGAIFDLQRCAISSGNINLHDPPLFFGKRHLSNIEEFQSFLDEEALEKMEEVEVQAVLYIGGLLRAFKLSENENYAQQTTYHLPELSSHEETQIVEALKNCLRESMSNNADSYRKIEDLDLLFMSNYENNETTFVIYKLSDCFLLGGEYPVELPQNPVYLAILDPRNGFKGTANSEVKNTKYETYCHFVNTCLANSVKTL